MRAACAGVVLDVAGPRHVFAERLAADRILELGEDLRVRLVQHVRHHVEAAAVRHADQDVADAGLGGVADDLVEHRHEHVEPFDREARLAGEGAVEEALEHFDLRQPVEQRDGVDRIRGGAEASGLHRLAQPAALLRHEHVREVVAGRRAVDAAERLDDLVRMFAAPSASADQTSEAGIARRSSLVTPCVSGSSVGSPSGAEPSGSSCAARCP